MEENVELKEAIEKNNSRFEAIEAKQDTIEAQIKENGGEPSDEQKEKLTGLEAKWKEEAETQKPCVSLFIRFDHFGLMFSSVEL